MLKKIFFITFFLFNFCFFSNCKGSNYNKQEIFNYFDDILLIINFNHPYYDNIDFLKEIYQPYFKNIVFYGEMPHPEVNVIAHNQGWFVQRAIADAMVKWPNYAGYICCQDDCFMNFWNLPRLDKTKIWFHQYWKASLNSSDHWWPWWKFYCGYSASLAAYKKLNYKAKTYLETNCGPDTFAFSWADFVYVSKKYKKRFIEVSKCLDNPPVFIEIAIPTILLSLENDSLMDHVKPYWGGTINTIDLNTYSPDFDWIHPIKLSKRENREFLRNVIINNVD